MTISEKVFEYLNKNVKYAVLRNYKKLPDTKYSRDVDLLIEKNDYEKNKEDIINMFEKDNYKMIIKNKTVKTVSYIFAKVNNQKYEIISFDFNFFIGAYGMEVISSEEVLTHRIFNGRIYHVNIYYEFLDKYFYNRMVGAKYPEKYLSVKDRVKKDYKEELKELFIKIFNEKFETLEIIDKKNKIELLSVIWFKNFKKNPFKQIKNSTLSIYYSLKNSILPKGFSIGFTGPDGAGKTTVLEIVRNTLDEVIGENQVIHFRPNIFPRIAELINKSGVKKEIDIAYDRPHRGKNTNKSSSLIRLCYYSLDYILGYWIKVRKTLVRRGFVIFDRYFEDIISDSKRSQINLAPSFINLLGKVVPKMDYHVLLTADSEVILARKQEITKDKIIEINKNLEYLVNSRKRYILINNNGTAEEAAMKILNHIFNELDKKNKGKKA